MPLRFLLLLLAVPAWAQPAGEVRGTVVDQRGGEPLARVRVQLAGTDHRTETGDDGRFLLSDLPPGSYTLHVATVGYRLLKEPFALAPGEAKEFEVVLSPDTLRQATSVEVRADPFEPTRQDSPSEFAIEGNEAKNLASVVADDPLRSIHAVPGVTSNDGYNSHFSVRGADYHRVGLYLDGILVHLPFHTVVEDSPAGSLTAINGDLTESLSLHTGAFPARYADRTGAALDVQTRDGSHRGVLLRGAASMSNASAMAEGPLGEQGAWLATVRKSYLQYILRRTSNDDTLAFGFVDGQGKLSYDLSPQHHVSLALIQGRSDLDRTRNQEKLGLNSPMLADNVLTIANVAWRYSPPGRFFVTNRAAYMRERYHNRNRDRDDLARGYYGEWVWSASGGLAWSSQGDIDFGAGARRLRDDGFWNRYLSNPLTVQRLDEYAGRGVLAGGYVTPSWNAWRGRIRLSAGMRWDHHDANGVTTVTPQAGLALQVHPRTQFRLGWGQYAQQPDLRWMFMKIGGPRLGPERSNHLVASLEHRFAERLRIRAEFFNRQDRDLLFRPLAEPRIIGGKIFSPRLDEPVFNSVRGYSRGFEVFLQRRSANRLSGWVSYAYNRTRLRDAVAGTFPSDTDQTHTVNAFGSYRLRPTVNLSARFLAGSGFPIPGFFRQDGEVYCLAESRNGLRLDTYHRLDARLNKAFVYQRWKMTLYAEVLNLYNRDNYRFEELIRFRRSDGRATLRFQQLFPIVPSVGIVFEFGG